MWRSSADAWRTLFIRSCATIHESMLHIYVNVLLFDWADFFSSRCFLNEKKKTLELKGNNCISVSLTYQVLVLCLVALPPRRSGMLFPSTSNTNDERAMNTFATSMPRWTLLLPSCESWTMLKELKTHRLRARSRTTTMEGLLAAMQSLWKLERERLLD